MNHCEPYAALLDAFAEGDLFYEDMIQVQTHLMNCPDCQTYLDDLLAMRAAFPRIEDTEVPEGFADRVMAAVAAAPRAEIPTESSAKPSRSKKKTPWLKVMAPLAACCAIVLLLQNGPLSGGKMESASYTSAAAPVAPAGGAESPAALADMSMAESAYDTAPAEEAAPMEPQGAAEDAYAFKSSAPGNTSGVMVESGPEYAPSVEEESILSVNETDDFYAILILSDEGARFLEDFPVLVENQENLRYHLTSDESVALQKQLQDEGIPYSLHDGPQPTSEMVLVIVEK